MNTSEQPPAASAEEPADAFQPGDHALMILFPALLILGVGVLFFGPGSLLENAAPAAMLAVFAVLTGARLYRRWMMT